MNLVLDRFDNIATNVANSGRVQAAGRQAAENSCKCLDINGVNRLRGNPKDCRRMLSSFSNVWVLSIDSTR